MTATEKPETPSVEELAEELCFGFDHEDGTPCEGCEQIAAALRAEREQRHRVKLMYIKADCRADAAEQRVREYETAEREDEDAACRLEELRAKFGIVGGTAEEIVGAVGLCLDMLMENQDRQEQRIRILEAALRCLKTGNPCGTDTLAAGYSCDCTPCRALAPAQEAK